MGDPAGIGGEIICKSLKHIGKKSIPVVIGDASVLNAAKQKRQRITFKRFRGGRAGDIEFIDLGLIDKIEYGLSKPEYGRASYDYIVYAVKLVLSGKVSAIVTCPINKASVHSAGINFPGHTEILAHYSGVENYVMMMANRKMRVSLVTIHIPIKDVPASISAQNVFSCIDITYKSLKDYFRIKNPYLKVCGLNPHAGEQGVIGNEETKIREAISLARSQNINVDGPFPADTLFHRVDCDAFIAMYHDQGLIPVKTIDFKRTVNITLGLPFVRTSPGHGTGFDIAGMGIADPTGFIEAYRVAEQIS